MLLGK